MMKYSLIISALMVSLASCTTPKLPPFSQQQWHVDTRSGHAVSSRGMELSFGSEWMITDTTLMQTHQQVADYQRLPQHLAKGIAQFPEIEVDSVLLYNPHRGLLFVTYHQSKPLKPTSETSLYEDTSVCYSQEYARIFGDKTTHIDDTGWEKGPTISVYTNIRYRPRKKSLVLLQRIPGFDQNIAVLQIWTTNPGKGKWWEDYPPGTFWNIDLGNTDNIDRIASAIHSAQNLAIENLRLALSAQK